MPFFELRRDAINNLIREQELKKWWVAEEAGVHKTTLRRWLSGRIERVSGEHVIRLATVLTTHPKDIAQPVSMENTLPKQNSQSAS